MIFKNSKHVTALLIATLAPFSAAHANTSFDGLYLGVAAGQSITTSRSDFIGNASITQQRAGGTDLFAASNATQNFKKTGGLGAIFAGYGFSCDPVYLGGELFFKRSNASSNISNAASTGSVDANTILSISNNANSTFKKTEFALDARPGLLLSSCNLLYGRIGVARNKHSYNTDVVSFFTAPGGFGPVTLPLSQSKTRNIYALRLGAGMEQMISQCVSIRLDYIHTRYRKIVLSDSRAFTYTDPTTGNLVAASFSDSINVKSSNSAFMLGVSCYW